MTEATLVHYDPVVHYTKSQSNSQLKHMMIRQIRYVQVLEFGSFCPFVQLAASMYVSHPYKDHCQRSDAIILNIGEIC